MEEDKEAAPGVPVDSGVCFMLLMGVEAFWLENLTTPLEVDDAEGSAASPTMGDEAPDVMHWG